MYYLFIFPKNCTLIKVFVLAFSLVLTINVQSQQNENAVNEIVTVVAKDSPIRQVLKSITRQTKITFIYKNEDFDHSRRVTIDMREQPIEKVLQKIFNQSNIGWVYKGRSITIGLKDRLNSSPISSENTSNTTNVPIVNLSGKITQEDGQPLSGASVMIKGTTTGVATDAEGYFILANVSLPSVLFVSSIGFEPQEVKVSSEAPLSIRLVELATTINPVTIVSSGYENIPKERATGSFAKIDNKTLNQQVSSDILSRLEGASPGIFFKADKPFGGTRDFLVRGQTTFSGTQALVIVDNFPYYGDFDNINPNDVESITILKDAAAASVWGSRAGNGVIVITTKKGAYNKKTEVQITSNLTFTEKPDLLGQPIMSVRDYIEQERIMFSKGMYNSTEQSALHLALSPVVELLIAQRDGIITPEDAEEKIRELQERPNVLNDYLKYVYRSPFSQRHSINISGGVKDYAYYVSTGYDKAFSNIVGNENDRITVNFRNTFNPVDRLEVTAAIIFSKSNNNRSTNIWQTPYPYERFLDDEGNSTSFVRDQRESFKAISEEIQQSDWQYRPFDEIGKYDIKSNTTGYLLNAGVKYSPARPLTLQLLYQYEKQEYENVERKDKDLYEVRSLINSFTQVSPVGTITHPIPVGDILRSQNLNTDAFNIRGQISYNNTVHLKHSINALLGYEINESKSTGVTDLQYGFNKSGLTISPVNYTVPYPSFINPGTNSTIPFSASTTDQTRRFISYYGNISYLFDRRIIITGSTRKDGANIYGVNTNQKWNPLWSTGVAWNIGNEDFFSSLKFWIPSLKLRATYGFTGSTGSGSQTAYTTATYAVSTVTGLRYALIGNPANPDLRWEKQRTTNLGLDFSLKEQLVSGSIEYYSKKGIDVIAAAPLDPTTGFYTGTIYRITRNYAGIISSGWDIEINSNNLNRSLIWKTKFVISLNKVKVTELLSTTSNAASYISEGGVIKLDEPLDMLYSYRWMGLDSLTGDPLGYFDSKISDDYTKILGQTLPEELIRHGSVIPPVFGSCINSFSWKGVSLDFSLLFKFGHYFRRSSYIFALDQSHKDFADRWQKPGDEKITNVPSIPETFNRNRNTFYVNSSVLVEKADFLRLQYLNLKYNLSSTKTFSNYFKNMELFINMSNLGLIWAANGKGIDPEYQNIPSSANYTLGIRATFK